MPTEILTFTPEPEGLRRLEFPVEAREDRRLDERPVIALVDENCLAEPVLVRGLTAAAALGAPLLVVLLHPRPGFTLDAAVAARISRRLRGQRAGLVRALEDAAAWAQVPFEVRLAPYARRPFGDPAAQARRAAEQWSAQGRLVFAAPSLGVDDDDAWWSQR